MSRMYSSVRSNSLAASAWVSAISPHEQAHHLVPLLLHAVGEALHVADALAHGHGGPAAAAVVVGLHRGVEGLHRIGSAHEGIATERFSGEVPRACSCRRGEDFPHGAPPGPDLPVY